jgi:hypothetical protein
MERLDQDARELLIAAMARGDPPDDDSSRLHAIEVDAVNLKRLKHIIIQDGFPTIAMVGVAGVNAAFLITQHADEDPVFQERMLRVVTARLHDGEITGNEYALLTDRILRARKTATLRHPVHRDLRKHEARLSGHVSLIRYLPPTPLCSTRITRLHRSYRRLRLPIIPASSLAV